MSVTKKDLSTVLKKELKLSLELSDAVVDEFFLKIKSTLRSHKRVKLSGFGTFDVYTTKERMGRNPKTLEKHLIPAKAKVRFTSTSKAKYYLN
jgi:integration host factor subunit alpha